jgi:hypothetical protein
MRTFLTVTLLAVLTAALLLGAVDRFLRSTLARRDVGFEDFREAPLPYERDVARLLEEIAAAIRRGDPELLDAPEPLRLEVDSRIAFVSASDGRHRARTGIGGAHGIVRAVEDALSMLEVEPEEHEPRLWLRLDLVERVEAARDLDPATPPVLEPGVDGIALGGAGRRVLLPDELVAGGFLESDGRLQVARLLRGRADTGIRYHLFRCASWFREGGSAVPLARGHRLLGVVRKDDLLAAARAAGRHLARGQGPDGILDAGALEPGSRALPGESLHRHVGATLSLLDLYAISGDAETLRAAESALEYLRRHTLPCDAPGEAAVLLTGDSVKLSTVATAALAWIEWHAATGRDPALDEARRLGRYILASQAPGGEFVSCRSYPDGKSLRSSPAVSSGAAILALVRLHRSDDGEDWLEAAWKGARHVIDAHAERPPGEALPHDAWLLCALDELARCRRDPQLAPHALLLAEEIAGRQSRFPARADELGSYGSPARSDATAFRTLGLVAAYRLARDEGYRDRADRLLEAICLSVLYQLRTQSMPETAMFHEAPDRRVGGFRRGIADPEITLGATQYNISSLIALYRVLREERRDGIGRPRSP